MSATTAPPAPSPPVARPSLFGWTQTPLGRIGLIVALVVLLQVPLFMVSGLIDERQERQGAVLDEIGSSWGPPQVVTGPVLAVPFVRTVPPVRTGDEPVVQNGWARVAPAEATITGQLRPEDRRRGLFHATVYSTALDVAATFHIPAFPTPPGPPVRMLWNDAVVTLGATEMRGQSADTPAELDGKPATLSVQEVSGGCGGWASVPAGLSGPPDAGTVLAFRTRLSLRGAERLSITPSGRQASVRLSAPWATPGFTGANLPATHTETPAGFEAEWQAVGGASTGAWQVDRMGSDRACPVPAAGETLGVSLLQAVPTYQMVNRASKYGTLFLVLAFLTYFLFETLGRVRIHLAQYALLGLSVSLFALLLLALAEPLGFVPGYVGATAAVMAQASLYTWSVVGSARLAAVFAAVLAALFGFLFVVISLDTYSLLVGTIALFAILSVVMAATRRLDWSGRATAA